MIWFYVNILDICDDVFEGKLINVPCLFEPPYHNFAIQRLISVYIEIWEGWLKLYRHIRSHNHTQHIPNIWNIEYRTMHKLRDILLGFFFVLFFFVWKDERNKLAVEWISSILFYVYSSQIFGLSKLYMVILCNNNLYSMCLAT